MMMWVVLSYLGLDPLKVGFWLTVICIWGQFFMGEGKKKT